MQKILELAKSLDEAGRYEEADFVTRRVAAAAEVQSRREAQNASYGWWGANTSNAIGAGLNNLLGNTGQNLSNLYNQAVGLSTEAQNSPLPDNIKKVLMAGFQEIAQALSSLAANSNASAQNQANALQQSAQPQQQANTQQFGSPNKTAATEGNIRLAFMRDISGALEAVNAFRGYTDQILRNLNPEMERWIGQKLDYMQATINSTKSGIAPTNQGDWFTANKTTLPDFVKRVQNWMNHQRALAQKTGGKQGSATPNWQAHLKGRVPDQIATLIAPYIK